MRRCPTCSRVYDDLNLRFCLDDGTELVDKLLDSTSPRAVLPGSANNLTPTIEAYPPKAASANSQLPPTIASPSPGKRSVLVWLLGGVALVLVLAGGSLAAILLLTPKQTLPWHLVLQVEPTTTERSAVVSQTVSIIEIRLNAAGVPRFQVRPDGDASSGRILVNLPALPNPERIKNLISAQGKLELVHVISPSSPAPAQTYGTREEAIASISSAGTIPTNRRVLPYSERDGIGGAKKWIVVEYPAIIDGSDLRNASALKQSYGPDYDIAFSLKKAGADRFGEWTGKNIDHYIGVVLNNEVKSIAFIKSQISDQGEISGRFTRQSAEDLALVLRSGALPAPVKFVEERIDR